MRLIDKGTFVDEIWPGKTGRSSIQYLKKYLDDLKVSAVVLEENYIDRHYLDEYAEFYSRVFDPPSSKCRRLHYFRDIEPTALDELLYETAGADGDCGQQGAFLSERYLGFTVVRPLEGAGIGRTVLATYDTDGGQRYFGATRAYRVNLAGLCLEVTGLAYQEQDGGAAVCASTAIWSTLQKVAHVTGRRSPTPLKVTEAADSPYATSDGLYDADMVRAISRLGYGVETFAVDSSARTRAQIIAALRSRLPVILTLTRLADGAGHAITVVGYREAKEQLLSLAAVEATAAQIDIRGGAVSVLFAHDDNLGPYAHYEVRALTAEDIAVAPTIHEPETKLGLFRGYEAATEKDPEGWQADGWLVDSVIIAKPVKVRLSLATAIGHVAYSLCAEIRKVQQAHSLACSGLAFGVAYSSGVDFISMLRGYPCDIERRRAFVLHEALPRHLLVVELFVDEESAALIAYDATTLAHHSGSPLAVVVSTEQAERSEVAVLLHLMKRVSKPPAVM